MGEKTACVEELRSEVQLMLGYSCIKLLNSGSVLHRRDSRLSELGISDGSEIKVILLQCPDGEFKSQYQGNGGRNEGPYRVGFNYTAFVTASFDGKGKCHLDILETGGIAGDTGSEYGCLATWEADDRLKLHVVTEREWALVSDGEWSDGGDKCIWGVMDSGEGHVILDLSPIHGFGPHCRLDRVATPEPSGARVEASNL